jgi:hypothetical protein
MGKYTIYKECQMICDKLTKEYGIPKHKVLFMDWNELNPGIGEYLRGTNMIILCEEFVRNNIEMKKQAVIDLIKHELVHYFYTYHCKGFRRICDRIGIKEHTVYKHPDAWYPS